MEQLKEEAIDSSWSLTMHEKEVTVLRNRKWLRRWVMFERYCDRISALVLKH